MPGLGDHRPAAVEGVAGPPGVDRMGLVAQPIDVRAVKGEGRRPPHLPSGPRGQPAGRVARGAWLLL